MENVSNPSVTAARRLIRATPTATLATSHVEGGWPYASLVLVACRFDVSPVLLISTLAEHTKNIAADNRVSLLIDGTTELADRLTGARITVLANAYCSDTDGDRERFIARHPGAALYADFSDFSFFHLEITRGHFVAGFGNIEWINAPTLVLAGDHQALQSHEADIVAHMNTDHADAIELYATKLLNRPAGAWQMTGCDPEGCDLALDEDVARVDFSNRVSNASQARSELVALAKNARALGSQTGK